MCSYCGCESISVVGRFMAEHVEIVNACGDLGRACRSADPDAVRRAADHLTGLLHPHTSAEEVGIFAVLGQDPEFTDHVGSLCAEHTSLDEQLDAIRAGSHAGFPSFQRALRAHVDREENGLFPAAAIALDGPEWDRVDAMTPPPDACSHPQDHPHHHPHDHLHDRWPGHVHPHPHSHPA